MNAPTLTRRSFTKAMGGLVLAFSLDPAELLAQGAVTGAAARLPGSLNNNRRLDAWVRIGGDGNATVYTGKVELGQGILTALWQIAAEELDLPLSRVKIYSADSANSPDEGQTAGSQSIENSGTALRLACAEVRGMLVDLAAAKLAVPAGSLTVTDGVIMTPDRLKVTYGEIAERLDLTPHVRAFRLCLMCNAPLRPARSGDLDGRVPEGVRERHTRFVTCDVCRRVFWEGSHWKRMRERIDALADAGRA